MPINWPGSKRSTMARRCRRRVPSISRPRQRLSATTRDGAVRSTAKAIPPTRRCSITQCVSRSASARPAKEEYAVTMEQQRGNNGKLGSLSNPLRVAVFGAGPAGFYAVEELLRQDGHTVSVDLFDRLPTPYGLVRGGVAPDHQKIKAVIKQYEKVAAHPAFRFFGNVMLGRDVQVEDLRRHYDQIVYAVGNESDRRLDIPGEQLVGNHS